MKNKFIFDFIEILILFIFVVLPIRIFLIEPFFVRGESMEPNFHNFDYLIIDKISYRFRPPQRGEIIVFHPPFDQKIYYIKRIIGLPNEKLVIQDGKITVFNKDNPQGFVLNEDYIKDHYFSENLEVNLGPDEYFVLGDNREVSYDSRKWGPLKKTGIVGRVFFKISLAKFIGILQR